MRLKLRFPISIQISIFLAMVAFIPVAAMMMLKTYESQLLTMTENSNVQQARLLASCLAQYSAIDAKTSQKILADMEGNFDARIRILDASGKLLADSSRIENKEKQDVPEKPAEYTRQSQSAATESKSGTKAESKKKTNTSFIYRLFSIPVRIYRKFRPPYAAYSKADFYSGATVYDGSEIKAAQMGNYGSATRISGGGQVSVTLYSAMPVINSGKVTGIVLVSRSTWRILQNLYELRIDLAKVFLWSLAVVIVIAVFLGLRISFPLKKLAGQAAKCADKKGLIGSDAKKFTGQKRRDEIGDLSRSFTTLIEKLDTKIRYTQAFASDVNHEFKNPLSAIRSSAEILADSGTSESEKNQFTQAILEEVTRLERLLTGVRGISKIEGSDALNDFEEIPVEMFSKNIINSIKKTFPAAEFYTDFTNCEKVFMHPDYYERIVYNLLENAAGFATKIKLTVEKSEKIKTDKAQKAELKITVEDNGKGISKAEAEKIFERFYSNRPEAEKSSHTGLGLSIVKTIVDALEGKISIKKSEELGGALFEIKIPVNEISKKDKK